jgi:hypothetical protein
MWRRLSVGLLLLFLCGCLKTKDELAINADGSGSVKIETHSSIPPEISETMSMEGGMSRMGGGLIYPPVSEAEAQKFFPGKNFSVSVKQEKTDSGETVMIIEAAFKDINALLASPYGRAHQLSLKTEGSSLVLRGISGMEGAARLAEMKDEGDMGFAAMPGLADMQKKKDEMRDEFRVTLPNTLTAANGARDGKTATWIVERAKCKDPAEFAVQLGTMSEARCQTNGLKFSPATPVRLGLLPFGDLAEGAGPDKGSAPDTNKIAAAAKFVPYGLFVTRSLDLSGEGGPGESEAKLIGAIVVPQEFTPQKWGEVKLDEAVDAKGNNLKPGDSPEERFFSMRGRRFSRMASVGEEEGEDSSPAPSDQRHLVTLSFHPPDWKVNEIGRIKASATMQYFEGSEVVKLTNAIPANWIMDRSKMMNSRSFDSSEKRLNSARLAALGLSLTTEMGMAQGGMTVLSLRVSGNKADLTDVQAFDADGRPWPTFLQQQDIGEAGMCEIMIAGKPQPPLSLALLASGGGSAIEVPILLEHVPVTTR